MWEAASLEQKMSIVSIKRPIPPQKMSRADTNRKYSQLVFGIHVSSIEKIILRLFTWILDDQGERTDRQTLVCPSVKRNACFQDKATHICGPFDTLIRKIWIFFHYSREMNLKTLIRRISWNEFTYNGEIFSLSRFFRPEKRIVGRKTWLCVCQKDEIKRRIDQQWSLLGYVLNVLCNVLWGARQTKLFPVKSRYRVIFSGYSIKVSKSKILPTRKRINTHTHARTTSQAAYEKPRNLDPNTMEPVLSLIRT